MNRKHRPIPVDIGDYLYIDRSIPHGLRWKKPRSRSVKINDPAGCIKSHRRYMLRFRHEFFLNHRVMYFLETNQDPGDLEIDHIVHNDNSGPLRLATHQQNQFNRRATANSKSKYKGVTASGSKWKAAITKNGNRNNDD